MVFEYIEVIMQIISIGLVIAAAGLWAGAGVSTRPRHTDEQTLVGGAIWSQIIIPIGLMISKIVEETIDRFVEGYYLVTGFLLLWVTGIVLIVHETRRYQRRKRREELRQAKHRSISFTTSDTVMGSSEPHTSRWTGYFNKAQDPSEPYKTYSYDKVYYTIGVLCVVAGIVKGIEFIMFVILDNQKY